MGNLMSSLRWRATNFSLSQLRLFDFPRKLHSSVSSEKDGITDTTTADLPAESQKHILIVGGAYSGLSTIITLQKILSGAPHNPGPYNLPSVPRLPRVRPRITLLDERDGCYHTVGTPLVHTSPEVSTTAPRAWKKFADIPYLKDVAVVRGSVQCVDPERKTVVYATYDACAGEQQRSLPYDYIVCATGLKRDWPAQPRATTKAEYIHDAAALVRGLVDAKERIVVVGGGAVGAEFAGELKLTHPGKRITLIHSRGSLLWSEPLPEEFKAKALELLEEMGVEVLLNTRVAAEADGGADGGRKLVLSTGTTLRASAVLWCVGRQRPSTDFLPAAALHGDSRLVRVSASLNLPPEVPNHTAHFAVGDVVHWSGIKRCGSALLMGCFAATNILLGIAAAERGEEATPAQYPEIVPMLVLALGEKAVSYHPAAGLSHGVEPLKQSFGDDLGLRICWNCLNIEMDGGDEGSKD